MFHRIHPPINWTRWVSFFLILLAVGTLFYHMNIDTPLYMDDHDYSFSFSSGKRIASLQDIVESQRAHYQILNGRFVTHTLAQVFLFWGKHIFNKVNVVAFLLLGLLICFHGTGKNPVEKTVLLLFIYCAVFLLTPAFGQSFLWVDGASNYLYGILLILLYLSPFRHVAEHPTPRKYTANLLFQFLAFLAMLVLGFLAGATNENTSIALIAMVLTYLVYYKASGIRLRPWMLAPGHIFGCLAMLLAPSQMSRLAGSGGTGLILMVKNTVTISGYLLEYFYPLLFLLACLLLIHLYSEKPALSRPTLLAEGKRFALPGIYLLGALGATYSMIVSPYFPDRVWSGPLVLLLIFTLSFYQAVVCNLNNRTVTIATRWIVALLVICTLPVYAHGLQNIRNRSWDNYVRVSRIEQAKRQGETEVRVSAIWSTSKYSVFYPNADLSYNSDDWPNISIANYYGVERIIRDDTAVQLGE